MSQSPTLAFWYEFASTYSYPAALLVEERAVAKGVRVQWRPFMLGPIFKSQGWSDSPFNLQPTKGRYMWRDMERLCARHGLAWKRPSLFPRNGLLAARIAIQVEEDAAQVAAFSKAVFRANFAEDRDIADPALIAAILKDLALPASLLEQAASHEVKESLRRRGEEAVELGLFGAPSFLVGRELFWGGDRLDDALNWALDKTSAHA
jgi:2-hydroxychromene-2-carboxylate isomerase